MARKTAAKLAEDIEVLRAEFLELDTEDATDDDVARSEEIVEEIKTLKVEYDAAVKKEQERDVVRSLALQGKTEVGDGATVTRNRGPEVMRRVEAYESSNYEVLRNSVIGRGGFDEGDAISRALKAVEAAPSHVADEAKERMTQLLEADTSDTSRIARHMLMTGSPEYHQQFKEYVQSRGSYAPELLRAAISLTDANGGFLVPFTLDPTIILTNSGITGSIRSISRTETITTDTWNGVSSAGVSAEWLAEATQAADASPTFAQPTITPKKAAAWVFGSYEALADSGFANSLQMLLADAKVRLEEAAFATGNVGATRPRGVVAAIAAVTASIVSSATNGALVIGDVYNLSDAINPRQQPNVRFIAHRKILSKIRQFDTSGGGGFWTNLGQGIPQQLLGQPIYENSTMSSSVTTSANVLLGGDFSRYVVVDRVGMSVLYEPMVMSTNANRPTGQAGWFAFWRVGADVTDSDAFRLLQLSTNPAFTALA